MNSNIFRFLADNENIRECLPLYIFTYHPNFKQTKTKYPNGALPYHFIYTVSGEGSFTINGKTIKLEKGSLLFYKKDVPCFYEPVGEWKTCWLTFLGNSAEKLLEYYGFSDYNLINDQLSAKLINDICIAADKGVKEEQLSEMLYSLINRVGSTILNLQQPKALITAKRYMQVNYANPTVSVNDIAAAAEVTVSKLYRIFNTYEHTTPIAYMNNLRISRAKALLSESNIKIKEIASSVGFDTGNYFAAAFKQIVGVSPLQYRKK